MGRRSWVWNENVATNAGIAAVAAALVAGNRGHELTGTDQLKAPNRDGLKVTSVMVADETPITAAASGYVTIGSRNRAFQLPLVTTGGKPAIRKFPGGLTVPKGVNCDCLGNASGAGAEQHTVVLNVEDPEYRGIPVSKPPLAGPNVTKIGVTMATGALVTQTISGFVDITGRTNAFTNTIRTLPDVHDLDIYLTKIGGVLAAGQGGYAIRDKGGDGQLVFPQVPTYPVYHDLEELLGGAVHCKADEPVLVGGVGSVAAALTVYMEMVLSGPSITELD